MASFEEAFAQLNEYQRAAVNDDSKACLVNAKVGSGKTTVLITKIFYLYTVKQIPLSDMVVLTFTNKAANEIKERISKHDATISDDAMPYFGTFHSVALKMLKTILPVSDLGYTIDFAVTDPDEEFELARQIISENALNIKIVNKLANRLEMAESGKFLYGNMKYADDMEILVQLLRGKKTAQNKMNFSDLISNAITLLPKCVYRPKWIIVDEFQDSDEKQLEFITDLLGRETKIFAVGDPNQVIYSWRGSSINVSQRFKRQFHAKELSLPINYRSCSNILSVAKCFLNNGSELIGSRGDGSKITVRKHYNPFNEAEHICTRIGELTAEGYEYRDIAVLFRQNYQAKTLQDVFGSRNIPYEVSIRKTLKDVPVLHWFMCILRAAVNPKDIENAVYVLSDNQYGEHWKKTQARNIVNGNLSERSILYDKILRLKNWCDIADSVLDVYDFLGIDSYINPTSFSYIEDKKSIQTFLKKIDRYIKLRNKSIFTCVEEYIGSSALFGLAVLTDDVHLGENSVKLMTLHSAKGLEFRAVFIISANNGLIPMISSRATDEDEEKRLFFVGITRAKDLLEISYCTSPENQRVFPEPSKYLDIIPDHLLDRDDVQVSDICDLQTIRHAVQTSIDKSELTINTKLDEFIARAGCVVTIISAERTSKADINAPRRVKHAKYGIGTVISEDVDTLTVDFEDYGVKELDKVFAKFL